MYNVVIAYNSAFNIDTHNRSVIGAQDYENGSIFALDSKNATEKQCWTPTAVGADTKNVWMAYSPEVMYVDKTAGLSVDSRDFTNKAGRAFDAFLLCNADIIEMTGTNILTQGDGAPAVDEAEYFVPAGNVWKSAAAAPEGGVYLHLVDNGTMAIGDGAIAPPAIGTYKFEVIC